MQKAVLTPQQFLANLEKHFEGMKAGTLKEETRFRELAEWNSMQALIILASFDWDYGILVPPDVMKSCHTLGELYTAIAGISG